MAGKASHIFHPFILPYLPLVCDMRHLEFKKPAALETRAAGKKQPCLIQIIGSNLLRLGRVNSFYFSMHEIG